MSCKMVSGTPSGTYQVDRFVEGEKIGSYVFFSTVSAAGVSYLSLCHPYVPDRCVPKTAIQRQPPIYLCSCNAMHLCKFRISQPQEASGHCMLSHSDLSFPAGTPMAIINATNVNAEVLPNR